MDRHQAVEAGRVLFGAWKHVRLYDAMAQGRLGATAHAGKAGDLLGRLRMLEHYDIEPLAALAADAGISRHELEHLALPSLEIAGGPARRALRRSDHLSAADRGRPGRRHGDHHLDLDGVQPC